MLNNRFIDVPGVSPATLQAAQTERHSAKLRARSQHNKRRRFCRECNRNRQRPWLLPMTCCGIKPSLRSAMAAASSCRGFGGHWASSVTSAGANPQFLQWTWDQFAGSFCAGLNFAWGESNHLISRLYLRRILCLAAVHIHAYEPLARSAGEAEQPLIGPHY